MCGKALTLLLATGLLACSQPPLATVSPKVAATPFGEPFTHLEPTASHQVKLVIYRDEQVQNPSSVKIYVNDQLHAALMSGGFTESCLPPGELDVRVAVDGENVHRSRRLDYRRRLNMQGGSVLILRLQEAPDGLVIMRSQTLAEAEPGLRHSRKQIHLVSRFKNLQDCELPLTPSDGFTTSSRSTGDAR